MERDAIRIHPQDNVAVALRPLAEGEAVSVDGQAVRIQEEIPFGHKVALTDLADGAMVVKYGAQIGHTTQAVPSGAWLHSHNLKTNLEGLLDYQYAPAAPRQPEPGNGADTFLGYCRPDGRVGTRNELWIIPTVSCVNRTVSRMAEEARRQGIQAGDGIFAFPHNAGCSQLGDDFETTQKLLRNLVKHPNAGGVLLVSLGCENNDLDHFLPVLGDYDRRRIRTLVTQDMEGDEIEAGLSLMREIAAVMAEDRREECPASRLVLGFKCGGSDAFSGITANPLCGRIAERVTDLGGTAVLTEVPEMFGAEGFLMDRCIDRDVFVKAEQMINGFKEYFISHNEVVYDNPSPGNKQGGITTLEDKSCGCVQKGGTAPIMDVIGYGDPVVTKGLNMLYGPGNDLVSATAMTAAGAHLILFSTGRGTPFSAPAPTLKISTNTPLAEKKGGWIDFNTGVIADGEKTIDEAAKDLLNLVIRVASGEQTKAEKHGFREISIFKDGVVL